MSIIEQSRELKEKIRKERNIRKLEIRKNLDSNKSFIADSMERREIRQAKLKQIKDEMGMNLLPVAPSIVSKGKSMIKKGLSSSEKDEMDDLKNKPDMDDDDLQRFSDLQEKNSNNFEDMDEMRENLEQMRDSINQSRQNRIDLRQTDDDTMNDEPTPKRTQPEPQDDEESPIEDANDGNPVDKVTDDDMLESTANKLSESEKIGSDVGKVAKVGEEVGGEIVGGGGEIDPIQDIIGGLIAVGGAIGSAVSVEEKKPRPQAMPVIQQQQSLEGTQV